MSGVDERYVAGGSAGGEKVESLQMGDREKGVRGCAGIDEGGGLEVPGAEGVVLGDGVAYSRVSIVEHYRRDGGGVLLKQCQRTSLTDLD